MGRTGLAEAPLKELKQRIKISNKRKLLNRWQPPVWISPEIVIIGCCDKDILGIIPVVFIVFIMNRTIICLIFPYQPGHIIPHHYPLCCWIRKVIAIFIQFGVWLRVTGILSILTIKRFSWGWTVNLLSVIITDGLSRIGDRPSVMISLRRLTVHPLSVIITDGLSRIGEWTIYSPCHGW